MDKRRRCTPDYPIGVQQETSTLGVRRFDTCRNQISEAQRVMVQRVFRSQEDFKGSETDCEGY